MARTSDAYDFFGVSLLEAAPGGGMAASKSKGVTSGGLTGECPPGYTFDPTTNRCFKAGDSTSGQCRPGYVQAPNGGCVPEGGVGAGGPDQGGDPGDRNPPPEPPESSGGGCPAGYTWSDPDQRCIPLAGGDISGSIPPDIANLRQVLGGWYQAMGTARPPAYQGNLTQGLDPALNAAYNKYNTLTDIIRAMSSRGMQGAEQLGRFTPQAGAGTFNALQDYNENLNVAPFLAALSPALAGGGGGQNAPAAQTLQQLMQSGGAPDILSALDAIRRSGETGIQNTLSDIREQFGSYGLARGSDIASAQAQGAAQGYANIAQQQQTLAAQMMSDAQNRRLAAATQYGQLTAQDLSTLIQAVQTGAGVAQMPVTNAATAAQIRLSGAQGAAQQELAGANVRLGAAQLVPQLMQATTGGYGTAAAGQAGIGQFATQVGEANMLRQYQEWQRQQQTPWLELASQYATSFPGNEPIVPKTNVAGQLAGTGIAAAGASAEWWLPALLGVLSSRELKEDIQPVRATAIKRSLRKLPIYTWRYKGDSVRHIGPMAEEFSDAFGVGDRKTLQLVDVLGVLLASQKDALAYA